MTPELFKLLPKPANYSMWLSLWSHVSCVSRCLWYHTVLFYLQSLVSSLCTHRQYKWCHRLGQKCIWTRGFNFVQFKKLLSIKYYIKWKFYFTSWLMDFADMGTFCDLKLETSVAGLGNNSYNNMIMLTTKEYDSYHQWNSFWLYELSQHSKLVTLTSD